MSKIKNSKTQKRAKKIKIDLSKHESTLQIIIRKIQNSFLVLFYFFTIYFFLSRNNRLHRTNSQLASTIFSIFAHK